MVKMELTGDTSSQDIKSWNAFTADGLGPCHNFICLAEHEGLKDAAESLGEREFRGMLVLKTLETLVVPQAADYYKILLLNQGYWFLFYSVRTSEIRSWTLYVLSGSWDGEVMV
ncbi:hypothetical protein PAAG_00464 [Paracoccidioides lutzii Pb01]|uniref:Uncharacterized protein n=1 Tax=Paracoccidioides lutzii (strain ATCC MYA-826 / Pb01) TaxID=502779 RepID=C1GPL9_PARBA|nr:hypothetical protein PAAG_00464 [Paracoccidioides lutzii Pb01]EEH36141.2 hypothetical protein PAAG_00464 [Paracoccidioides lutzii Pb01]